MRCEAADPEVLFMDWLNALIYEMSVRRMLFSRFEVHLGEGHLEGRAWGERVDVARHEPAVEVKAATLTGLEVSEGARRRVVRAVRGRRVTPALGEEQRWTWHTSADTEKRSGGWSRTGRCGCRRCCTPPRR